MAERKFTRGLSKLGSAALVRESVSEVVRITTVLAKPLLVEPLDYETFVTKNQTAIQNDPCKDMLLFPPDDIYQSTIPRRSRTVLHSSSCPQATSEITNLFVLECLRTYATCWHVIHYKYGSYSCGYSQLPKIPKTECLEDLLYEMDTLNDEKELQQLQRSNDVVKEGYVMENTDLSNDSVRSSSTKSFRKRFACIRKEEDGRFLLEFYSDEKKTERKFIICLNFCIDVAKNPRRGKYAFELNMQEQKRCYVLSAENEADLEDWVRSLNDVIHYFSQTNGDTTESRERFAGFIQNGTSLSTSDVRSSELAKFSKETVGSIAAARKESRQNLFAIYPDIITVPDVIYAEEIEAEPYKEQFGARVFVRCESLKFDLQMPSDSDARTFSQVEPYVTTLALFNAKAGKKISADFKFDVNCKSTRRMMTPQQPRKCSSSIENNGGGDVGSAERKPSLAAWYPEGFDVWLSYPNQAVFNISEPDPDIYLVVRIEKVLQGSISQAVDPYLRGLRNGDLRTGCKVNKNARASCLRLGNYFMPLAWSAKPLFRENGREIDTYPYCNTIYKQEGCHLSNENLLKYLAEWKRPDKKFRLIGIPGLFKVAVEPHHPNLENCVTPSLAPVSPFPWPPVREPTVEVDDFPIQDSSNCYPFVYYANRLYIYPKCLQYDNQKSFTKARNIACIIEFRDSDDDGAVPLKCIYGKPGESLLVNQARCAVSHHSTVPNFYEEVKIEMPLQLNEKHHILFIFRHITCEVPKSSKKKEQPLEIPIGYAWLPLYCSDKIVVKEQMLSVSENLPSGYLSWKSVGSDKKPVTLDVRWVDGGRPLFKLDMKLISTIYSMDQHLNNFFLHVHKLVESKYTISVAESSKTIKALHAMDSVTLIKFLPTVLNQLFRLLVSPANDGIALDIVRVLIHFVNTIQEEGKIKFLKGFIKYIFVTEPEMGEDKLTIHEELTKSIIKTLRPANTDFIVINKFLRNSWFFFQIIIKSMAQHLLNSGKMKLHRHERFPADYQFRIQNLTQVLIPHITQKFKDFPEETRRANRSLGHFIKKCLNLMDRGFVFKLINFYVDKFNLGDPKTLQEYKFEFLQIVLSHEHYVALNLPTAKQDPGSASSSTADLDRELKLSKDFCQKHFLVGILLQEVKVALNEVKDVRRIAVAVLMNMLAKHSFDDRYQTKMQQARISSLYLPFITVILENLNRFNFPDNSRASTYVSDSIDGSLFSSVTDVTASLSRGTSISSSSDTPKSLNYDSGGELSGRGAATLSFHEKQHKRDSSYLSVIAGQAILGQGTSSLVDSASLSNSSSTLSANSQAEMECPENGSETNSVCHVLNDSIRTPPLSMRYDKLMPSEVKDILICFLYIVKNVTEEHLIGWWQCFGDSSIIDFFHIIQLCLHHFRYLGKRHILHNGKSHVQNDVNPKSLTLPARVSPPGLSKGGLRTLSTCSEGIDLHNNSDAFRRVLLEANIATEVGLIALDILGVFCAHFKEKLLANDGDNGIMRKIFDIYIFFLQIGQSEKLLNHVFAAMRAFIMQFPAVLFDGDPVFCGQLCYEILKCCSSHLLSTRNEACAFLYLLMRGNYNSTQSKGLSRVHLQVIISVSRLQGDFVRLNNGRFQESLSVLNSYAENDEVMQTTSFPSQVMDLTKRIYSILMATMQMHKHEYDPEMLIDLQHSLANSYATTYELRRTWLQNMAKLHLSSENFSEAAFCHIHIAALIAEYLKQKGIFQLGCEAFVNVSPNILKDEKCVKEDAKIQDTCYTEDCLIESLAQCAEMLEKAERYESIAEIYKISIPMLEKRKDYQALSSCYKHLHNVYDKIVEVNTSGKRLLGRFYRVAFFGERYFKEDSSKEYIYKEPKVTSLPEISERLYFLFCKKFGKDVVKMIMDSVEVRQQDLDSRYAYIQVTHVTPYLEENLASTATEFEKNNKISDFVFETPFTLDGQKARGAIHEQCKRKTILTTKYSFPYVKKRIEVAFRRVITLKPIEVAIEEMETRTKELIEVTTLQPPDVKKLQLKLQGSISVQVNAGPLAYAKAFLDEKFVDQETTENISKLKAVFRAFVHICGAALDVNERLIVSEQHQYHEALKENFQELIKSLSQILNEQF